MKYCSRVLFFAFVVAISSLVAQSTNLAQALPYPDGQNIKLSELMKQKITPPPTPVPIDDYLIALAKAGNANFIADVTDIPKEREVQPFPATPMAKHNAWEPKLYLTLFDLTQQSMLSRLNYDPTTFLFWNEPDAGALARQLVEKTEPNPNEKLPDAVDLYLAVTKDKNLLENFPIEGKVVVDITLRDLPPEQSDEALAIVRQLFIGRQLSSRAVFFDTFWNDAVIRLETFTWEANRKIARLNVHGQHHQTKTNGGWFGLRTPEINTA